MDSMRVLFPQKCSHLSCAIDSRGRLLAAMVSARRLLFMRDGSLCAQGPLCVDGAAEVRQLRLCNLSEDTRMAIVTTNGVTLVDVTEPLMHLTHRQICVPLCDRGGSKLSACPTQAPRGAVDAEFITPHSLAVVFSDEAVIVELRDVLYKGSNHGTTTTTTTTFSSARKNDVADVVRWRCVGSYMTVSVCRTNLHLAFASRSATVEVFPMRLPHRSSNKDNDKGNSKNNNNGIDGSGERRAFPVFSPTQGCPLFSPPIAEEAAGSAYAGRGVSTHLGKYRITTLSWHRVTRHTILCVACEHPHDGHSCIALFTLQSAPITWPRHDDDSMQLIPAGNIDLAAKLVPNLSRSPNWSSAGNKLEFLSVDPDGTVRTAGYNFGQQKRASFTKERSTGRKCRALLQPLLEKYGAFTHFDVLPLWCPRQVEFGPCTPQAEQLLSVCHYRLVVHFSTGLVVQVMLDLLAPTMRVEAFLTLGVDTDVTPHFTTCVDGDTALLLGLTAKRAFVLARRLREPDVCETVVRAVAPIHATDQSQLDGAELMPETLTVEANRLCFTTQSLRDVNKGRHHWTVKMPPLEGFAAAEGEVTVRSTCLPSTETLQRMSASPPCNRGAISEKVIPTWKVKLDKELHCEIHGTGVNDYDDCNDNENNSNTVRCELLPNEALRVCGMGLPDAPPLSFTPFEDTNGKGIAATGLRLADRVVLVGVTTTSSSTSTPNMELCGGRVLRLYSLDLLRDVTTPPRFRMELELRHVMTFALRRSGEAIVVLCHPKNTLERWGRGADGEWKQLSLNEIIHATVAVTHEAPLPLLVTADEYCLRCCETGPMEGQMQAAQCHLTPHHHPLSVLLLLSTGRQQAAMSVVESLVHAMEMERQDHVPLGPAAVAHALCSSDTLPLMPRVSLESILRHPITSSGNISSVPYGEGQKSSVNPFICEGHAGGNGNDDVNDSNDAFNPWPSLIARLPVGRLLGLDDSASDCLHSLLAAARAAKAEDDELARSDAAAARCLFLRRLPPYIQLPSETAALWATLAESPSALLDRLLGPASEPLSWEIVERASLPFWVPTVAPLRVAAERIGRAQYQTTRDVRECALMYCAAGRVAFLIALCRTEHNERLLAFFSRDFTEERNRAAASANGFAAVGKGQLLYGAAFFILAGDARSAAQIILQRQGNVALALFVLRLAGNDGPDDMAWFLQQRRAEVATCGLIEAWEEACLLWRGNEKLAALHRLTNSIPQNVADAAERLALLRHVGRSRRMDWPQLSPKCELESILHTARRAAASGLRVAAALLYTDARRVLEELRESGELTNAMPHSGRSTEVNLPRTAPTTQSKATMAQVAPPAPPPRMAADFNTGTLTFQGFDDSDDDDDESDHDNIDLENNESKTENEPPHADDNSANGHNHTLGDEDMDNERGLKAELHAPIDPQTIAALSCEIDAVISSLQHLTTTQNTNNTNSPNHHLPEILGTAIVFASHLTCSAGRLLPLHKVEHHLARLLAVLKLEQVPNQQNEKNVVEADKVEALAIRLILAAVRLALVSVAVAHEDYALANALLSMYATFTGDHTSTTTDATAIISFLHGIRDASQHVRRMTFAASPHEDPTNSIEFGPTDDEIYLLDKTTAGNLGTFLFSWFASYMRWQVLSALREDISCVQAIFSNSNATARPPWAMSAMHLFCSLLCRATLDFSSASASVVSCVVDLRHLDASLLTNPNDLFLEEEYELRFVLWLLEENLRYAELDECSVSKHTLKCSDSENNNNNTNHNDDKSHMMDADSIHRGDAPHHNAHSGTITLDLCVARAELFWQLPPTCTPLSTAMSEVVDIAVRSAAQLHNAAGLLCGQLRDGAVEALRRAESAWLRRHHTHWNQRELLLTQALCGGLDSPATTTDRLVLKQGSQPVSSVDYDRATCDGLVWGTAAGVAVAHGYREILAGDNEAALVLEQAERNIATAALATLPERHQTHAHTSSPVHSPSYSPLHSPSRPHPQFYALGKESLSRFRQANTAPARVASHPHLPFFLMHRGGDEVELHPFAVTSSSFPASGDAPLSSSFAIATATTTTRTAATTSASTNSAHCVAVFRCGDSCAVTDVAYSPSGYIFAVGLANGSVAGWRFTLYPQNGPSEPLFVHKLFPPGGLTTVFFCGDHSSLLVAVGTEDAAGQGRVGVLLLVDLVMRPGTTLDRCALPFTPHFAVYLASLHAVLCVTVDGRAALYAVRTGRLCVVAAAPPSAAPLLRLTCVAASPYDELLALGTGDGHALLLRCQTIDAAAETEWEGGNGGTCYEENGGGVGAVDARSVLGRATRLQLTPTLTSSAGVRCLSFTPSVLLAGLVDGKTVAAALIPNALRQTCTI